MKRLLLVGGGHAHVHVLAALAARPLPGVEVTLLTPYPRQIYSGMLPGWVAGRYAIAECAIDIERLAGRAGVRLEIGLCSAFDASGRRACTADGRRFDFDLASLDTGSVGAASALSGAGTNCLSIRPIETFIAAWPGVLEALRTRTGGSWVNVVGGGAAGVEMAFAIASRAQAEGISTLRVRVIDPALEPLQAFPAAVRRRVSARLERHGIEWAGGQRVRACHPGALELEDGDRLAADFTLVCGGAAAPSWLRAGGLAVDAGGFVRVGPTLQSLSHPQVLAAGDIAAYASPRPKSGVFAVRAGPVLATNLRAACSGRPLRQWTPQRRALYLISAGAGDAIACWGGFGLAGAWAWRWKDRIDRDFMARFG